MGRRSKKTRVASLHDELYGEFIKLLVQRRKASGQSQQDVADALGWNQSIIAKIETAQRRVDLVELARIADVVGFDLVRLVQDTKRLIVSRGEIKG